MASNARRPAACAIYTRKSTEHGLQQDFHSLDAQREAAEAFIKSQAHEGWRCLPDRYDDGWTCFGKVESSFREGGGLRCQTRRSFSPRSSATKRCA